MGRLAQTLGFTNTDFPSAHLASKRFAPQRACEDADAVCFPLGSHGHCRKVATQMEDVAHHLQMEALVRPTAAQRDSFGRSAFNRYYYAAFLPVNRTLRSLRPEWAGIKHKDIPDLMRGKILTALKKGQQQANRVGDRETAAACARAISLCYELAELMKTGYAVRVTADYEADVAVDFSTGIDFRLATVAVSTAKQWPSRATAYAQTIHSAWKQIGD